MRLVDFLADFLIPARRHPKHRRYPLNPSPAVRLFSRPPSLGRNS